MWFAHHFETLTIDLARYKILVQSSFNLNCHSIEVECLDQDTQQQVYMYIV